MKRIIEIDYNDICPTCNVSVASASSNNVVVVSGIRYHAECIPKETVTVSLRMSAVAAHTLISTLKQLGGSYSVNAREVEHQLSVQNAQYISCVQCGALRLRAQAVHNQQCKDVYTQACKMLGQDVANKLGLLKYFCSAECDEKYAKKIKNEAIERIYELMVKCAREVGIEVPTTHVRADNVVDNDEDNDDTDTGNNDNDDDIYDAQAYLAEQQARLKRLQYIAELCKETVVNAQKSLDHFKVELKKCEWQIVKTERELAHSHRRRNNQ